MMKVKQLSSFPPDANPFCHDAYHMGEYIGENVCVMYGQQAHGASNSPKARMEYLIVINLETGERIRIEFGDIDTNKIRMFTGICNNRDGIHTDSSEEILAVVNEDNTQKGD